MLCSRWTRIRAIISQSAAPLALTGSSGSVKDIHPELVEHFADPRAEMEDGEIKQQF
jgi:hypothetical protein